MGRLVCKRLAFAALLQTGFPRGMFLFNYHIPGHLKLEHTQRGWKKFSLIKYASFFEVGMTQNRHRFWVTTRFL